MRSIFSMKISYQSPKLETTLQSYDEIRKKHGDEVAKRTIKRLQELDGSDSLADLPVHIRPHPHDPKQDEIFSVDIQKHKHSTRLLFKPIDEYDIADYSTIKSIEIIEIKKLHS